MLPRNLWVTSSKSFIRHGSASAAVKERLEKELDGIKNAGTWKTERVITSRQDVSIDVQGSKGKILNFCANNYLGLSVSKESVRLTQYRPPRLCIEYKTLLLLCLININHN